MNIKIIKSFKDLDDIKLKQDWHELWNKSLNAEVFLTYEWIYVWCKHFINNHKNRKLFIILIYSDKNILEAIVPLYSEIYFIFLKALKFFNDKRSDYLGFLINKDIDFENVLNVVINFLESNNYGNIIHLKQISENISNLIVKKEPSKLRIIIRDGINSYYTLLPESIDIFMKKYNAKQRYNILYPLNKIKKNEKDAINYIEYSNKKNTYDSFNISEPIEIFFDLHQKRWRDKGQSGIFRQSNVRTYFMELFKTLYENNLMHLSFLQYHNKYIAGAITFEYVNKRELYLISFDSDYLKLHPGILLAYFNIESAINNALKEFDFLRGDEDYKKKFFAVKRNNFDVYFYKNKIYYYLFKTDMLIKKLSTFFTEKISINIERIVKFKM